MRGARDFADIFQECAACRSSDPAGGTGGCSGARRDDCRDCLGQCASDASLKLPMMISISRMPRCQAQKRMCRQRASEGSNMECAVSGRRRLCHGAALPYSGIAPTASVAYPISRRLLGEGVAVGSGRTPPKTASTVPDKVGVPIPRVSGRHGLPTPTPNPPKHILTFLPSVFYFIQVGL